MNGLNQTVLSDVTEDDWCVCVCVFTWPWSGNIKLPEQKM